MLISEIKNKEVRELAEYYARTIPYIERSVLRLAFIWTQTQEGHNFWTDIDKGYDVELPKGIQVNPDPESLPTLERDHRLAMSLAYQQMADGGPINGIEVECGGEWLHAKEEHVLQSGYLLRIQPETMAAEFDMPRLPTGWKYTRAYRQPEHGEYYLFMGEIKFCKGRTAGWYHIVVRSEG